MSLLRGRSHVVVHVPVMVRDEWGTYTQQGTRDVVVRCTPKWGAPTGTEGLGPLVSTIIHVLARQWPAGAVAGTRFSWDGYVFEQIGVPQRFYGSARTSHVKVWGQQIAVSEEDYHENIL